MGGKAVHTAPATWPLVLVRSIGPPLVAAAVLAGARPPWPQWAAHAFFLVLLVPVAILTVDRVFGARAALILGIAIVVPDRLARRRPCPYDICKPALANRQCGFPTLPSFSIAGTYHSGRHPGWSAWERTELAVVRVRLDVPDTAQAAGVTVVLNGVQLPMH